MRIFLTIVTAVPMCAGLMLSQTAADSSKSTQSWTGLLVAGGCQNSATTTATNAGTVTENGTAKDRADGTSDMKNSTPETANANASNMAANEDGWMNAEKTAAALDKSCQISNQTASFALRLRDGRLMPFDDASNSKIASQLQSANRLGDKTKIFRVVVKGTLRSDRISLDSIKI